MNELEFNIRLYLILAFFRLIYIKKYIRHISKNMNRSTVGIEKSFYYEFLKKRQNKKAVYPRYTAPCLTKIYYFLLRDLLRVRLVLMGSGGYHFLKNRLKPHFLPSIKVCWIAKKH